ncbi:16S rRNA (guanine(527)-N(7))-methyltransferase RsmG [uncultured Mobiluncus sp.]|uniref:16S rRNA (guanine(527)-N(7))-methyltransferase RsmG n=1 Tax=uncultured Mobiluncus sp. TaxID=293425 RepID=UPI0025D367B6|nr:16S rRNA (guanine(527)-N(7))-methyltransferase RsmG [uncultured Mobiluncus sp.]
MTDSDELAEDTPPEVPVEPEPADLAEVFDTSTAQMRYYADLLSHEGLEQGLLGPREAGRIWSRHILNCWVLSEFLPEGVQVADVGSGAGLPGLVLAIGRPDLSLTLIESMTRRCEWLQFCVEELGLDNVRIRNARAEDFRGKQAFSYLTARAVGNLSTLLGWTAPLVKKHGTMLFLKGASVEAEIEKAKANYVFAKQKVSLPEVLTVSTPLTGEPTRVVRLVKK